MLILYHSIHACVQIYRLLSRLILSEAHRRALVFQKRYLQSILNGIPNFFPHGYRRRRFLSRFRHGAHALCFIYRQVITIMCSICFYSFGTLAKAVRLFIASLHKPAKQAISKCVRLTFSTTSNQLAELCKGALFSPRLGVRDDLGIGDGPIRQPTQGFLLYIAPH